MLAVWIFLHERETVFKWLFDEIWTNFGIPIQTNQYIERILVLAFTKIPMTADRKHAQKRGKPR